MAEGIVAAPNQYDFGLEFDYSVWVPGTQVDLVNVPWNNDYRDVVRFADRAALNAYIDSRKPAGITYNQLSYVKPSTPVYLPISHNRATKYNYIRVSNPLQPIDGGDEIKYYYYFILDVEYIAPQNTRLILQLDVWQTFIYDVTFGQCYVQRGHIGIANSNSFNNWGRDYLTIPEGLDTGSEYVTTMVRQEWVMTPSLGISGNERYPGYDILVVSTNDLLADPGTKDEPNLETASGSQFEGTIHGANMYVFEPQSFFAFMGSFADKPWITQGIISITMVPRLARYHPGFSYATFPLPTNAPGQAPSDIGHNLQSNWRDNADITGYIGSRYVNLKKLWTFPYMVIEMTTFMGTPILLKPEVWNSANAEIKERASLVPPAQRVEFYPSFYNSRISNYAQAEQTWPAPIDPGSYLAGVRGDDYGEYLDLVTQIANFPTMAIVNNGAISYLAANTHSIANQYRGTDWSQQRALGMAQGQYDIATGAMHNQMNQVGSAMNADIAQTANMNRTQAAQAIASSVGQGVSGVGMALTPGGFGGAAIAGVSQGVVGGVNAGIQIAANDEALAIRNTMNAEQLISNNRQAQLMRDTNKSLADWAARGDYAIQRGAIDAKVQDAALIQPTTSGQIGGETMNIVNGGLRVSLRWKMIDKARMRQIGEYWLRYGYAVHAQIVPPQSLKVMSKFTYWKMIETYIAASTVSEGHKQAIRGILEKGVTVWENPSEIGVIDWAANSPLAGVSY